MAYATLEALKRYLRISEDDTLDDPELTRALDVASAEIDHICSQTFDPVGVEPTVRVFLPYRGRDAGARWRVPIVHITGDVVGVWLWNATDSDYTTAVDGFTMYPYNPGATGYREILLPTDTTYDGAWYGWGEAEDSSSFVAVEALWGWAAVPPAVEQACLMQAVRVAKRREAPFGMINTLDGSEMTRLTRTMDPDVVVALRGYIRYWAAR